MQTARIAPQKGPQEQFLSSPADIAIYGGAAGAGKSFALLLEPICCAMQVPGFHAVFFRRNTVQVRNPGGLWDESVKLYGEIPGAKPLKHTLEWDFSGIGRVKFAHLEHDTTVLEWQGSALPLICFDELTHFSASQFWYLLSRNRSTCGVRPYIRATCNPDADSWVSQLISWWIDPDTGFPIAERAGVLRWFIRVSDELIWADDPAELRERHPEIPPKSLTFIPAKLSDNPALMRADPGYLANLLALPLVERERLLGGNWKIRWSGQGLFDEQSFLVGGLPVPYPAQVDGIYAVVDSAVKGGAKHDGTAVVYFSVARHFGHPLVILDWDVVQIDGAFLENWIPGVFARCEELARECRSRRGILGVWIEDAQSGSILLQQCRNKNLRVHAIPSKLTSAGKDNRAVDVSGHIFCGKVKIAEHAYRKVATFKSVTMNHLTSQVMGFRVGDPDANKRADDLLDCMLYGTAIGLGNSEGF